MKMNFRGHYLKALCWRALNQAHIQGKKPLDKLNILRQQIDSLPKNQLAMAAPLWQFGTGITINEHLEVQ